MPRRTCVDVPSRGPHELEATVEATKPISPAGRVVYWLQRVVIGPPLRSSAIVHERMRKLVALPVLSSDLLSSVAYGPEAMLSVLVLAGHRGLGLSLPLAALLLVLMLAVGASYWQRSPPTRPAPARTSSPVTTSASCPASRPPSGCSPTTC